MRTRADILDLVSTLRAKVKPSRSRPSSARSLPRRPRPAPRPSFGRTAPFPKAGSAAAVRAAVLKAAKEALVDVIAPCFHPATGCSPGTWGEVGEEREGVRARNMCPSRGTMDVFIEPVLPRPQIVLCGSSPVALAIADLARWLGFAVTACAPASEQSAFGDVDRHRGLRLASRRRRRSLHRRLHAGQGR